VILATGDAAGFRLCDGDDGGLDFVGCFGDGAEGLDFCYGCSLRGDLRAFVSWLNLLGVVRTTNCDSFGLGEL
jgi:hypothetical protein